MRERIKLDVTDGPLQGEHFEFEEPDVFIFGRAADCHARLPAGDRTASRHHFLLEIKPPRVAVRDLGSLNGTFVNGEKIGSRAPDETPEQGAARALDLVVLHDGDEIRVGETAFSLDVEQPAYCPRCGRVIAGRTAREQAVRDDPRCDECRDADLPAGPGARPGEIESIRPGDADNPLGALVRVFMERRGLQAPPPAGAPVIAGYEIGEMLGKGAMGAVYLGRRLSDGQEVAVKVMLAERQADERARWMFAREVQMQERLSGHPNCVPVYEWDMEGPVSYFVMEFCPGGSVDGLMARRGGRLTVTDAAPLMLGCLDGLVYAHSRDVVHRDLKPQNVLLTERGGGTAKLTDFGLSKDFELAGMSGPLGTTTGAVGGTPAFLPRDQVVDFKYTKPVSDVWGMAATFYNMLTGALVRDFPPGKDPINIILSEPPVPIRNRDPSLPAGLAAALDRALADEPGDRFPTAAEFRSALVAVL